SSRWRHDLDLKGKRVAVIGTGASAIQFVPAIQPLVAQLTVFQRTPHWVLPKMDQSLPPLVQQLFKRLPLVQRAVRGGIYGIFETLNGGMQSMAAMKQFQRLALLNLKLTVKDPGLRRRLSPNYVIGCKRVLQSSDWYPALVKPNVNVVSSALTAIEGNTLIAADGSRCEADVIILGTGFEIAEPPIAKRIFNRHGQSMADVWQGSPEGYMGTMVAGCPNGFLMFGPNIAVSSSALIIIEAQLAYIVDAIKQAHAKGIVSIETDPVRTAEFNQRVQAALADSVWNRGGCHSYFIDRNGRNSTVWPWTTFEMRRQLSRFNLDEYIVHQQSA
ncbi:MAG: NAD(P)/FAD-dependent oxidoreductase, partial [Moraxellaceae bacterium]|nr:NAD(P)/FAD-dependent oxidoreductase [Moraxellaceae bacterium]